jgi:hypothetical protein
MILISQKDIDRLKWDSLVAQNQGDVFSYSWYLDACAEDWCVLVDDFYLNGIALPLTSKLGVLAITPPIFVRNLNFIGKDEDFPKEALKYLQNQFQVGHIQTTQLIEEATYKKRIFQTIEKEIKLGSQAKRMIQKAKKNELEIRETQDWKAILEIIRAELSEKISEFTPNNLEKLAKLMQELENTNRLLCLGIYKENLLQGGMVFMDTFEKTIYLKGAATAFARDNGGMYSCMQQAIERALNDAKPFDFGGSEVPGVRRFNQNLGGIDQHYYIYTWNYAPAWFKFAKRMYQLWKKK